MIITNSDAVGQSQYLTDKSGTDNKSVPLRVSEYGELTINKGSSPGLPVQHFLSINSVDGSGANTNANGNYLGTNTDFFYTAIGRYDIHSVLISIADTQNFNYDDYGAIPGGLVNGIRLYVYVAIANTTLPLLSGRSIKKNFEWFSLSADVRISSFAGLAQNLTVEFNLADKYGKPIGLNVGDKFIMRANDNFTHLVNHTVQLRGIQY